MPSLKYVIELSAEDKAELIEIVTKGKSPAEQFCERIFFLLPTGEAKGT